MFDFNLVKYEGAFKMNMDGKITVDYSDAYNEELQNAALFLYENESLSYEQTKKVALLEAMHHAEQVLSGERVAVDFEALLSTNEKQNANILKSVALLLLEPNTSEKLKLETYILEELKNCLLENFTKIAYEKIQDKSREAPFILNDMRPRFDDRLFETY